MWRLWARAAPYRSRRSSFDEAENGMATLWVANTSCFLNPSRSMAVERSRLSNAPSAWISFDASISRSPSATCAATCSGLCRPPWPTITATSSSVTIEAA